MIQDLSGSWCIKGTGESMTIIWSSFYFLAVVVVVIVIVVVAVAVAATNVVLQKNKEIKNS